MTASENYYARALPEINPSRYPLRTLRVPFATARFSTKLETRAFSSLWKRLETLLQYWRRGNASGEISHCRGSPYSKQTIGRFTLAKMGLWWLKALNCKSAFA